jgi:hypothetical protein
MSVAVFGCPVKPGNSQCFLKERSQQGLLITMVSPIQAVSTPGFPQQDSVSPKSFLTGIDPRTLPYRALPKLGSNQNQPTKQGS